jgi:iron complex outermembrane receptor protein
MVNLNKKLLGSAVCLALTQGMAVGSVQAQDADKANKLDIEEVIVTGTKRAVAQQDLGMSVSTLTETQIKNSFVTDVTALTQLAPNVNILQQNGFNAVGGGIRGTGFISILVTKDPSVGVTVDDFAFNHVQSQFVEMFDVEQVEVFRGPAGTLFGKNTTGGAINITTKKPVMNDFFGDVDVQYGQFDSNDGNITKVTLGLNIPLIDDTLSARLAVIQDETDGYYTNGKAPGFISDPDKYALPAGTEGVRSSYPAVGRGEDIGGKDVLAGKFKLAWTPSDFFRADFTYEYVDDESDTVAATHESPGNEGYLFPLIGFPGIKDAGVRDPLNTGQSYGSSKPVDIPGGHQVEADGYYLTMTFNFDDFTLKSISGMRDQEEILASTYTGEAYTSLYDASRNSEREQTQQEFRLTSELEGPFNFVAGAAYYTDDVDFLVFADLGFVGLANNLPVYDLNSESARAANATGNCFDLFVCGGFDIQAAEQERTSYAAYIDGSYDISEKTTIWGGLRYTEDEKDFKRLQFGTAANPFSSTMPLADYRGPFTNPISDDNFGTNVEDDKTWTKTTWRVQIDHDLSEEMMIYASYATGFVAGGFSETCGSVLSCKPYAAEENNNFELGLKSELLDGDMRLNLAGFYTEYENLQRSQVVTIFDAAGNEFQETLSVNDGDTEAYGFEVEMTYLPTDNLRFDFNLGYLHHEYDEFTPTEQTSVQWAGVDLSGLDVPFSPEWNYGLSATYFMELGNAGTVTFNGSVHYQDEMETQPYPADAQPEGVLKTKQFTQVEERTLVDAYVMWDSFNGMWNVAAYGKNLTDETWRQSANAVAGLWNFTRYAPPREYGVRVGISF